jgi:hypothetical protein
MLLEILHINHCYASYEGIRYVYVLSGSWKGFDGEICKILVGKPEKKTPFET